jgi:hypothetical protein
MPDFAVSREVFMRYIEPPIGKTKFHDLVNKGQVLKARGLRGYYLLNESLQRLGSREVRELPKAPKARSLEDIARLAFTLIDPVIFPAPPWLLAVDVMDVRDFVHAEGLADNHRQQVEALEIAAEKLHYFAGVLDAQVMIEADGG